MIYFFIIPTGMGFGKVPTELGSRTCQEILGLASFLLERFMLCQMICMNEMI